MKLHSIFVGNKFIYNRSLKEYVLRKVEQRFDFIDFTTYFKENDNSLFLHLEEVVNSSANIIIVTSKSSFSTIGKLICTVTDDNQVLKENMLIPQKSVLFENGTYLTKYKDASINVISLDEMQLMPEILLDYNYTKAVVHIFDQEAQDALVVLKPIAHTYDVEINIVTIIDGWLRIDIISKKFGDISKFIRSIKRLLPKKVIATSNLTYYIIETLFKNNKKITFAESCTGGLLSYNFTKISGASKILDGSLITYSNHLKENWLAVDAKTIEEYGAVSKEVVLEMSDGALDVSEADYAISISGIAGESGGTKEKPVGTVCIGVRNRQNHVEKRFQFNGDRNYIQYQSVLMALKMVVLSDVEIFF